MLIFVPILSVIGLAGYSEGVSVGVLGVVFDGPEHPFSLKFLLMTIFMFGGFVAYLILTGSRNAFRVGLWYGAYAYLLSITLHVMGFGIKDEVPFAIIQYLLLTWFVVYLAVRRRRWEASLIRDE